MLRDALSGLEGSVGESAESTIAALAQIGWSHNRRGEFEQAVSMLEKAGELARTSLGETHEITFHAATTLVSALIGRGDFDEAERLCERIVIIDHGKAIASGTLDTLIDQTVGRSRQVTIHVRGAEAEVHSVQNVAAELPALLSVFDRDGRTVDDVRIEALIWDAITRRLP